MAGIKPTDFQNITPTGATEIYTQTGGVNGKFTLDDAKEYLNEWTEVVIDISAAEILTCGTIPVQLLPGSGVGTYYEYAGHIEYTFVTTPFNFGLGVGSFGVINNLTSYTGIFIYSNTPWDADAVFKITDGEQDHSTVDKGINQPVLLTTISGNDPVDGDGTFRIKLKYKINTFG